MATEKVLDSQGAWLRESFLVPMFAADLVAHKRHSYGPASLKYVDTSLGGNFYINQPPQACQFTDIRVGGRNITLSNRHKGAAGMGGYHSMAFDDNALIAYLRFGMPSYNSLTTFFTSFYDSSASLLARTGRAPSAFYYLGKAVGFVASVPLMPLLLGGAMFRFFTNSPSSKFYYSKPAMTIYWARVQTIANDLATKMGIVVNPFTDSVKKQLSDGVDVDEASIQNVNEAMYSMQPDIYYEHGGINAYAIANKATRMARHYNQRMEQMIIDSAGDRSKLLTSLQTMRTDLENGNVVSLPKLSLADKINLWINGDGTSPGVLGSSDGTSGTSPVQQSNKEIAAIGAAGGDNSSSESFTEYSIRPSEDANGQITHPEKDGFAAALIANFRDGSEFVGFRVTGLTTISESFSNSTRESDLESMMNSKSAENRNAKFNLAGMNLGDGLLMQTVGAAIKGVADFATGIADSIGISGLASLAGSAFVDIPKHYDSSSWTPPGFSITLELQTPYGVPQAIYNNLLFPLAMVLAGGVPIAAGKAAYTAPMLCEFYCQGRATSRLAIISGISITRGEGTIGFTQDGKPLGMTVTVDFQDLTSINYAPITADPFANPFKGIFAEDSQWNDYMATICGVGLNDQVYSFRKLRMNLLMMTTKFRRYSNPYYWAGLVNGFPLSPGRLINAVMAEQDRTSLVKNYTRSAAANNAAATPTSSQLTGNTLAQ